MLMISILIGIYGFFSGGEGGKLESWAQGREAHLLILAGEFEGGLNRIKWDIKYLVVSYYYFILLVILS